MCDSTSRKLAVPASPAPEVGLDLTEFGGGRRFRTFLADPPWRFENATGKVAPEHRRLARYPTLSFEEIFSMPVGDLCEPTAHLYLWVPNALLPQGLECMARWGFSYKTMVVWHKLRKDGGSDGRGVGFYFRNVTEVLLFGVRGKNARTEAAGRRQVNYLGTRKREHSRKPDEQYALVESCSRGPYVELFSRGVRPGWACFGNQASEGFDRVVSGPSSLVRALAPVAAPLAEAAPSDVSGTGTDLGRPVAAAA